jgi:galacturonosyltransferase
MDVESLGGFRGLKHWVMEGISWKLMRFASRVICVSETVAEGVRHIVPIDKVSAIPNWVPLQEYPQSHAHSHDGLNVVFVGRLEKFKGGHLLIEALRILNERSDSHLSLTVVGDGKFRAEMERLASGLTVHFVGFQSDPTPFYRQADVFVNPSCNPCEGMPLTSLEAMSHGLPCIFSDIPQNLEIAESHASALLFKNGDIEDLAAKLELCVHSTALLEDLGARARREISERYCPEAANSRYLQALAIA